VFPFFFTAVKKKLSGAQAKAAEAMKAAAEWQPKAAPAGSAADANGSSSGKKGAGTPFSRMADGDWSSKVGTLSEVDNSYEARFGEGGYGHKASAVLALVRGKDFRHEKTKRKRGTYRGGVIDTGSGTSFKFANSDNEDSQ
jgi:hypothetical protein